MDCVNPLFFWDNSVLRFVIEPLARSRTLPFEAAHTADDQTEATMFAIRYRAIQALAVGALVFSAGAAFSQGAPSEQKILDALKPTTRSLSAAPADAARAAQQQKFIETLRNRQTRSLTTDERQQIASIAKEKPSIDLEINFDYNSAEISKTAMPGVTALGKALANAELKDTTFVVAGHTDAKGEEVFNQNLSERRADAIKKYLVENYKIPAANLVTVGYGETQLKNKDTPEAGENRRVQVVNMQKTAGK
jgi:outer membrane protein OmpA-like peptidoglycan-associated protein